MIAVNRQPSRHRLVRGERPDADISQGDSLDSQGNALVVDCRGTVEVGIEGFGVPIGRMREVEPVVGVGVSLPVRGRNQLLSAGKMQRSPQEQRHGQKWENADEAHGKSFL